MVTETSGEYDISIIKYFYDGYVVFQFEIHNMLTDQIYKDVTFSLQLKEPLKQLQIIKSEAIGYGQTGYSYIILSYEKSECLFPTGTFKGKMSFSAVEVDPTSKVEQGNYSDEYVLPDITLSSKDYIKGKVMTTPEFKYLN